MWYTAELAIPANTSSSSPVSTTIHASKGKIKRVRVRFPRGGAFLVKGKIKSGHFDLAPYNPEGWLSGNGDTIEFDENIDLKGESNIITFQGHSAGTIFSHKIYFGLLIEPERPVSVEPSVIEYFKGLLGKWIGR
uniref:Uncharacterized protein n=1 Tax=viral metagenome TaxID=1070528 RepID=A0A6H2A1P2_9ZZZZ